MTKTIGWTTNSGKKVEITFTHTSEMVDDIAYADGDNINLGRKPYQSGEIVLKVEDKQDVKVRYDSSVRAVEIPEYVLKHQPSMAGYYMLKGTQIAMTKENANLVNAMIKETVEAGKTDEYRAYEADEAAKDMMQERKWAMSTIEKAEKQGTLYTAKEIRIMTINYNNINNEGGEGFVPTWVSKEQYEEANRILAK